MGYYCFGPIAMNNSFSDIELVVFIFLFLGTLYDGEEVTQGSLFMDLPNPSTILVFLGHAHQENSRRRCNPIGQSSSAPTPVLPKTTTVFV